MNDACLFLSGNFGCLLAFALLNLAGASRIETGRLTMTSFSLEDIMR